MGHLKDIANQPKVQSFPDSTFEIAGEVPAAQCSEAKIEGDDAFTLSIVDELHDVGNFTGWNLIAKICTITVSPTGNTGDFVIFWNDGNTLKLTTDPGDSNDVEYYIHNGGSLILTRNIPSFAQFIHAAGYAYTIKGGKLYTNIPSAQLQPACSILFDPLT